METELKPCPFCGTRNAHLRKNIHHFYYVLCEKDGCYVRTDGHLNEEAAIETWNRRAEDGEPL